MKNQNNKEAKGLATLATSVMAAIVIYAILMFMTGTAYGQNYKINRYVDEMTNEVHQVPERMVLANSARTEGFKVMVTIRKSRSKFLSENLIVNSVNIGSSCVENSTIIFLLENGERVTLLSWNKFNCDGKSYFAINTQTKKLLSKFAIVKARFKNGRDFSTLTLDVKGSDQHYFQDMYKELDRINQI